MIFIQKVSESKLRLNAPKDVLLNIAEQLEFFAVNYMYTPKYRSGQWDGKIRLLNSYNGLAPAGLAFRIGDMLEEMGLEYELDDDFKMDETIQENIAETIAKHSGTTFVPHEHQANAVYESLAYKRRLIISPTGCHEKGHPILMFDGSIKNVEDIIVGDLVMGPDSKSRKVIELHRGTQNMFRVTPVKGESFVVNEHHIFSFTRTPEYKGHKPELVNMTALEFYEGSKWKKHTHKLEKCAVDFEHKDVQLDPYLLGALLGDGCFVSSTPSFTTKDEVLLEYVTKETTKMGMTPKYRETENGIFQIGLSSTNVKHNIIVEILKIYGLNKLHSGNKFIPDVYKINSREVRLNVLAGLIDTDGHLSKGTIDYISKSERLARDVVFLCRSLGISAYISKCTKSCQNDFTGEYFRVSISGNLSSIPTKLVRKKTSERKQIKNNRVTGLSLEPIGLGEYYGFELDGDSLYLDGYFTRHHNSGKSFLTFLLNKHFEKQGIATLIIVPRKALAKQLSTDYIDYQGHAKNLHTIIGGVEKDSLEPTVITTWQSIMNQPPTWFSRFGAVIVDEAHDAKAASLSKILDMCTDVKYRIGMTGTTDDEIPNELTLEGHFGPKVTVAETWELIEKGILADLTIKVLNLNYDDDTRLAVSRIRNFADEKLFIKKHKRRNELISGLAASQAGNMLVLVEHRDQLDELVKMTKLITKREIFVIHGDIKIKDREKIRVDIESKDNVILFATFGSFSVGSNVKKLDKCILATSFKSKIRVLQSIGRTLRKGNGSVSAVVYDIADDMSHNGKPNFTLVHARGRMEHYVKGRLKWEIVNVRIKTS